MALSGHDHDYERFAPKNPWGRVQGRRGVQQFVAGTGGKSLYPKSHSVRGSHRFINSRFGVLELILGPAGYSWAFRDLRLRVRDSGHRSCR